MKNLKLILFLFFFTFIFSCSDKESFLNEMPDSPTIENLQAQERQIAIDFEPAPCSVVSNIGIFIDCSPSVNNARWRTGILAAINEYNNTSTGINMRVVQTDDVDEEGVAHIIEISCVFFQGGFAGTTAFGEFPAGDGALGNQIFLNEIFGQCMDACFFTGVVMHELGHTLGMVHNDHNQTCLKGSSDIIHNGNGFFTFNDTEFGFIHIPNTTAVGDWDNTSVFNSVIVCNNPNCAFNQNDLALLEFLYPEPEHPCNCPRLFEACACEETLTLRYETNYEEARCVPPNANINVCAYGNVGPTPEGATYSWGIGGDIVLSGNTQSSIVNELTTRCIRVNVGANGGSVSVFVNTPNEECGNDGVLSLNLQISVCENIGGGDPTAPGFIIEK